jgi:CRISPR-associated protein Cas1
MLGRIIELTHEGSFVRMERGFLIVENDETGGGRAPLDDIEAVIASAQRVTYSNAALAALADRGAPLVICGKNYAPTAVVMPVSGQFEQGVRMAAQAKAVKPLCKRLWAQIVRAKILAQSGALDQIGVGAERLKTLARTIRSGDPTNHEAQAAQAYWPLLMGKGFRRDREGPGANSFLNYGYAVLRAATARAIVGAGLHPSLSIQHQSRGDALRLADDLMEPFRPAVDLIARDLVLSGESDLTPAAKRHLSAVLHADYATEAGVSTLSTCLSRLSLSLAYAYLGRVEKLDFPKSAIPLPNHVGAAE